MRSFKSNENIHKKEDVSYYVVLANKASSMTLQSPGNESQRKHTAILRISKLSIMRKPAVWSAPLLFALKIVQYFELFYSKFHSCLWAGRFESYLVASPEDRFFVDRPHIKDVSVSAEDGSVFYTDDQNSQWKEDVVSGTVYASRCDRFTESK